MADEYEVKAEYDWSHKAYLASQGYMTAKGKGSFTGVNDMGASNIKRCVVGVSDTRIEIQSAEDEKDIDDGNVGEARRSRDTRYVRNHRLVHEIFLDVVVPDVRSASLLRTSSRMAVIFNQVLGFHCQRLKKIF